MRSACWSAAAALAVLTSAGVARPAPRLAAAASASPPRGDDALPLTSSVATTGSSTDLNATCNALATLVPSVLAQQGSSLGGEKLELRNAIALLYENGAHPTVEELGGSIPKQAFRPTDNVTAQTADTDWTRAKVMADEGYGYQDKVQTETGGLPSFCRFGATIVSSPTSQIWFEVWLPLPASNDSAPVVAPSPNATAPASSPACPATTPGSSAQAPTSANSTTDAAPARRAPAAAPSNVTVDTFVPAPRDGWKGRLIVHGGGGLRGTVAYADMKQTLTRYREAVAGTNAGHFSSTSGVDWVKGADNAEVVNDFGYRAPHLSTLAASEVVKVFYGVDDDADAGDDDDADAGDDVSSSGTQRRRASSDASAKGGKRLGFRRYWRGCSTGGRQGFGAAQRFPDDFDGILAGSPAIDYNYLNAYQIKVNSYQADNTSEAYIPTRYYPAIHAAVLEACDADDGVKDLVVSRPERCKPDFRALLLCAPGEGAPPAAQTGNSSTTAAAALGPSPAAAPVGGNLTDVGAGTGTSAGSPGNATSPNPPSGSAASSRVCLTEAQIANLERIYSPYRLSDGTLVHEPALPGSELGWNVTSAVVGKPFGAAPAWYQYWLQQRTDEPSAFDPFKEVTEDVIRQGQTQDPGRTNTFDTDLSGLFANDAKLIHYHGLADPLIPPGSSVRYNQLVSQRFGRECVAENYRLFLVPGMMHCRFGEGAYNFGGASQVDQAGWRPLSFDADHDMMLALFGWAEGARSAPSSFVGASYLRKSDLNATSTTPAPPPGGQDLRSYVNGVRNTRRLCTYPQQAVLVDAARPDVAESYECRDE